MSARVRRGAEGVMFLGQIAEGHDKKGRKYLGRCRVPAPIINEKLQEDVVEKDADKYHSKITSQLRAFGNLCLLKDYVTTQVEPHGKGKKEANEEGCYMSPDGDGGNMNGLFFKKKVEGAKEKENIQQGIGTAAGGIAEGLQGEYLSEWRIKSIYHFQDETTDKCVQLPHSEGRR